MKQAVDLSRLSQVESDGRVHPFVDAVIVNQDGLLISSGFHGKHTKGNHAEQEALVNIPDDVLKGAVVYFTLEPCTGRGKQTPCCLRQAVVPDLSQTRGPRSWPAGAAE